tara:strand:+ start:1637 stop:1927 length:291 start_codon:yes stop_codon:yes gene_type:complete
MKKRVPPNAQSKPKVAAMCIHNFLFSGNFVDIIPEIKRGIPSNEGKYEVIELESEICEITTPHKIRKTPYEEVIVGIVWPPTVNCSLMIPAPTSTL